MFGSLFGKKMPQDIQNAAGLEIRGIVSIAPKNSGIETYIIGKSLLEKEALQSDGTIRQDNSHLIALRRWKDDLQMSFKQVAATNGDKFISEGSKNRLSLWIPRSSFDPNPAEMIVFSEEWTGSEFSPREWGCGESFKAQFTMAVMVPTCCRVGTSVEENILLTYPQGGVRKSTVRQSPKALVQGVGEVFESSVTYPVADNPRKVRELEAIARKFGL